MLYPSLHVCLLIWVSNEQTKLTVSTFVVQSVNKITCLTFKIQVCS